MKLDRKYEICNDLHPTGLRPGILYGICKILNYC